MSASRRDQREVTVGERIGGTDPGTSLTERLAKLPADKRWPMTAGLAVVSLNSTMVGLITNSYFRRMCMLRGKGVILGIIPIAGGCAVTTQAVWHAMVTTPLVEGNLRCPLCTELRGGLVNFTFGSLYPVILAVPINGALATMFKTIEVPKLSKSVSLRDFGLFWINKLRFFKVQFATLAIFQTLMGWYLARKQYETAELLRMTETGQISQP